MCLCELWDQDPGPNSWTCHCSRHTQRVPPPLCHHPSQDGQVEDRALVKIKRLKKRDV